MPSVTFLWKGAEWMEREAYDMFGITFEGNRDLRRIYMPPDYQSFPLRKDFYLADDAVALARRRRSTHGADAQPEQCSDHGAGPPDAVVIEGLDDGDDDQPNPPTTRGSHSIATLGVFEPVPPYPPRTEREAEFYTLGDGQMFINVGPQHPSTHGVLRVVLKIDGEKVVDLDPVLGYLHRGVEKLCENADYHQAICYTDPLEYVSSLFTEWSPVIAFEKLMDVKVPAPRRVHPRPVVGAQPDRQPRALPGLDGARPGRADADPLVVHRARRDRRHAGAP